jgi:tRNA (uracil-5-)-methyltransferase TRM9
MDLSNEFVKICISKGLNVIQGNILNIPFDDASLDNAMSIAVIHHLEKRADRITAIKELLRITKIGGEILIYVWAFEQPIESKRQFLTTDEMVPYKTKSGEIYYRYYHLYQQGELESELNEINIYNCDYDYKISKPGYDYDYDYEISKSGYDYGNYYIIIKKVLQST